MTDRFKAGPAPAAALLLALLVSGCATQRFVPPAGDAYAFLSRGVTQEIDGIRVTAAVPSAEETRRLFGADLYDLGVQPVWLSAENNSGGRVRFALRSIDDEYFSAYEVAWLLRDEFASSEYERIERWLYDNKLLRRVPAGESRSGFVYTHMREGTKGFNVDLFSSERSYNFTFFVPMPDFRPDYMDVDFRALYDESEIRDVAFEDFRSVAEDLPCCSTDESGEGQGDPINIIVVGSGEAMRRTLLRADWNETSADSPENEIARRHFFLGRPPDGTFHKSRPDGKENKELRLWLAPIRVDGEQVWIGQVSYEISGLGALIGIGQKQLDPDVDSATWFLTQDFWYSQSLRRAGLVGGIPVSGIETPAENFLGQGYFTSGLRAVLFISESPVALDETVLLDWTPPHALAR